MADTKNKMQEYTEMLAKGTREVFESGKYSEYLSTMSKFHKYSARNVTLIYLQMPDATAVAGYNKWRDEFQRQVLKGSKAIKIYAPAPYKVKEERAKTDPATGQPIMGRDGRPETEEVEVKKPSFKLVNVFDISQTDGKPLPQLVENYEGDIQYYDLFRQALEQSTDRPITYEHIEDEGTHGYVLIEDGTIHIDDGMSQAQTAAVTIHEMAHAMLLHDEIPEEETREERAARRSREEVEAESVAFVVSQYFGFDTGAYSFGYVANWSREQDLETLKASLDTIKKAASTMIDKIETRFTELKQEHGIEQTVVEPEAVRVVPSETAAVAFATDYHALMTSHNIALSLPPFGFDEPEVIIAEIAQEIITGEGLQDIRETIQHALEDVGEMPDPEVAENLEKEGNTLLRRLTGFEKVEYIMPPSPEGMRVTTPGMEPEVPDGPTTEQAGPDTPERFAEDYVSLLGDYNRDGNYYPQLGSQAEQFAVEQLQYGITEHIRGDLEAVQQAPDFAERATALINRLDGLALEVTQTPGLYDFNTVEAFSEDLAYGVRSFHEQYPDELAIASQADIAALFISGNHAAIDSMIETMAAQRPYSNPANSLRKRFALAQAEQRLQEQARPAPELSPLEQFGVDYHTFMHDHSTRPQPENWLEENMDGFEQSFKTGYNGHIRSVLEAWQDDPQHGEQAQALLAQLDAVEHELWPEPVQAPMRDRRAQFGIDMAQIMESYYSENPAPSETGQMAHTSPSFIIHQVEVGYMPYIENALSMLEGNEQYSRYAGQFRERLATLEPLQASEFELGYAHMGNGLSVYNRLEEKNGDYVQMAHIGPDRTVHFYDNTLPGEIRAKIEHEARTTEMTVSATQDTPVFTVPPQTEPVEQAEPVPDTAEILAYALNQFAQDAIPYDYADNVDDPEQQVQDDARAIENGGEEFEGIKKFLLEFTDDDPQNMPGAMALLDRLTAYSEQHHQELEQETTPEHEQPEAIATDIHKLFLDVYTFSYFQDIENDEAGAIAENLESIQNGEFDALKDLLAQFQEDVDPDDAEARQYSERAENIVARLDAYAAQHPQQQVAQETTPEREQPARAQSITTPELGELVADTTITPEQREQYEALIDDGLLPLNKDRALELFAGEQSIYRMDGVGNAFMIVDESEIAQHDGIFAIDADEWQELLAELPAPAVEQATEQVQDTPLLPGEGDRYAIYQIENTRDVDYAWRRLPNMEALQYEHYKQAYTAPLEPGVTLDGLWDRHNRDDRPAGQTMRSMSMSDVIVTVRDGKEQAFYVDDAFTEVPQFLEQAKAAEAQRQAEPAQPEVYRYYSTQRPVGIGTYPTGQIVNFENFDSRQPVENGAFQAWGFLEYRHPLTEQQMKDYELRPAVQESHIRAAEMSTEDNYNMIDGIPNNTSPEPVDKNAEPEPQPVWMPITSSCVSNYEDMVALIGADDKVYLGNKDAYDGTAYNNADNSLVYISDTRRIFEMLYSPGMDIPQQEAMNRGHYPREVVAEFVELQAGVLAQFKRVREFLFDGKPVVPPPTMAELEADVAAGKQISLMDMAHAIKEEKRPTGKGTAKTESVLGQLKENKAKTDKTPRDPANKQDRKNEREV